MLRKFLRHFVPNTHYWRDVGFDELSEIYASQLLRSLAVSLINIFVPVYLYSIGFSLEEVLFFFFLWFALRLPLIPFWAYLVGRIGPKHGILLSMMMHIFYLTLLATVETLHWPLPLLALVGSIALSLFWISFHTDLSKVRHPQHAGKELSFVNNFERIGAIAGPFVGGLVANFFNPVYAVFLALIVMILSVIPLLMTKEPVRTRQKITFRGFPYRANMRTALVTSLQDLDIQSCQLVWPLFVAIAVFSTDVFGKLGLMAGLSVALGLLFTHAIGKVVDNNRGGELFRFAVWANAVVYLFRPFVRSLAGVFTINFFNDPITTAFRIPFLKGYHDQADSYEGYRIVFFTVNEWFSSLTRAIFWLGLFLACAFWPAIEVLRWHFILMAFLTLGLLLQRFPALAIKPRKT